jgi:hypothetical protein
MVVRRPGLYATTLFLGILFVLAGLFVRAVSCSHWHLTILVLLFTASTCVGWYQYRGLGWVGVSSAIFFLFVVTALEALPAWPMVLGKVPLWMLARVLLVLFLCNVWQLILLPKTSQLMSKYKGKALA